MVNIFKRIWNYFFGGEVPPYPVPFGIISYSPEALDEGIADEQNKIIIVFDFDKIGNKVQKIFPYSASRVYALENEAKIPIYDKTEKEDRYPVWLRSDPQELSYLTR